MNDLKSGPVLLVNPVNRGLKGIIRNGILYENASVGLLIIESEFKKNGIKAEILDLNILCSSPEFQGQPDRRNWYDLITREILGRNAGSIGFTTMASNYVQVMILSEKIKKLRPGVHIFLGGPQATLTAEKTLEKFGCIDFICCGEFESQANYIKDLFNHTKKPGEIPNLAYRDENGTIKRTGAQKLINLGSLDPSPLNFDLYRQKDRANSQKSYIAVEGGRGCPFNCSFCSTKIFWQQSFRLKNINSLVNEIKQINELYSPKMINILHDLFTVNKKAIKKFCAAMKTLNIKWICSSRIDTLDRDTLQSMKDSGCIDIFFGIESGDTNTLKQINKNIRPEKSEEIINYCSEIGIQSSVSFIIGFPFEKLGSMENSLKLLSKFIVLPHVKFALAHLIPLPGTEISAQYGGRFRFYPELYFDSREIERIEPELEIRYIRENPELFSFFYFIDSENFNFYYIRTVIHIFEFLAYYFKNTLYLTSKKMEITDLINSLIPGFRQPFLTHEEYGYFKDPENIHRRFGEIITSYFENSRDCLIFSLFRYENDLYTYGRSIRQNTAENESIEKSYEYHIPKILMDIRKGKILDPSQYRENFLISLSRADNQLKVSIKT